MVVVGRVGPSHRSVWWWWVVGGGRGGVAVGDLRSRQTPPPQCLSDRTGPLDLWTDVRVRMAEGGSVCGRAHAGTRRRRPIEVRVPHQIGFGLLSII